MDDEDLHVELIIEKAKSVDDVLREVGRPGRFHILLCCLLMATNGYIGCHHMSFPATYGITPKHRCAEQIVAHSSVNKVNNNSIHVLRNATVDYQSCSVVITYNDSMGYQKVIHHCKGPWEYDRNIRTIVTEWNLVCEEKFLPSIVNIVYFVGVMIGGLVWGMVSDRFGRRPVLLASLGLSSVIGIISVFSPNAIFFAIFRFMQGFVNAGAHSIVYIMPAEASARKYIGNTCILVLNSFIIGVSIGCIVIWGFKDWKHAQLALCVPSVLLFFLVYKFVPESIRWLLVSGKEEAATALLKRIAKFNGVELQDPDVVVGLECKRLKNIKRSVYGISDVFKHKEIRRRSLLLYYLWAVSAIAYYTLSVNLRVLLLDPFLAIMIGSVIDIPSFLMAFCYIRLFGKRRPSAVFLFVGGSICIVFKFYSSTVIAIIGKGVLAVVFGLIFLYIPELYPTVIRNIGIGLCTMFARFGSVLGPQIFLLGLYTSPVVPVLIVGCTTLLGAGLMMLLPETHLQKIPDTIEEVEGEKESKNIDVNRERDQKDIEFVDLSVDKEMDAVS